MLSLCGAMACWQHLAYQDRMTPPSSSRVVPANKGAAAIAPVTLVTATALAVADMVGIGVFTSLGFQVKDLPSGFSLRAAVDGRRRHGAVRSPLLCRTRRSLSPLGRRVQLPLPHLSPGGRASGRLGVGHGRLCGPARRWRLWRSAVSGGRCPGVSAVADGARVGLARLRWCICAASSTPAASRTCRPCSRWR